MRRIEAIIAVHGGASITDTARRFGVNRATLHRWLNVFDPKHPVASLRPRKRGPKSPRWSDEVVVPVMRLIADHPDWWGKRRVAQALHGRGVTLSEATAGRILVAARQRIAETRQREASRQQAERRRQARVMAQRHQRDAERRAFWQEQLEPAFARGLSGEERLRRIAQALASKGWKIQTKDLTPELRDIADDYLAAVAAREIVPPSESWLLDADRWVRKLKDPAHREGLRQMLHEVGIKSGPNIDHLRVGALNHLAKNCGPAALAPAQISISDNDQGDELGRRQRLPLPQPR
jgi:transposase